MSVGAALFSFDSSGILIAFSQLIRLLLLFRYINVFFGDLLENFMEALGEKLEVQTMDQRSLILN